MNAKEELLKELKPGLTILCAQVEFGEYEDKTTVSLKTGYTSSEYEQFLASLNRVYDSGYGGQELFGTVWLEDGTWLERGEYDGAEWWEHKVCPAVPDELK